MPPDRSHLTEHLIFRVTPEDKDTIRRRAVECGLTVSAYLRQVALGAVPRARPHQVNLFAIHHLARLGNNLNQLTKGAHERRNYLLTRRLESTLEAIDAAVAELVP